MTASTHTRPEKVVRSFAAHTPKWQRFQTQMISNKENSSKASNSSVQSSQKEVVPYQRQYSHVYTDRLGALKDRCWKALKGLGDATTVERILELKEDHLSMVVGTIVVESANGNSEPSFPTDDEDAMGEDKQIHPEVHCRSRDQLFLEDESGRVALRFLKDTRHHAYEYCTGVVVGVMGVVDAKGMMHVHKIVDPVLVAPPSTEPGENTRTPHLLLVSSLLCGDPEVSSIPRDMLVSYLQGHFGIETAASVSRIVVAGSGPGGVDPIMGLKDFDLWGLQVTRTAGIPMDILPSSKDPTTRNWPQRPLHSSLLPHTLRKSSSQTMARTTPNPYQASIGNQIVLGTDGLNVRDLQKYILKADSSNPRPLTELEALEQSLRWAHICPTAPNSPAIGMVPSSDPMVMDKGTPNLYFCGNAEEGFATKLISYPKESAKTRLICVPKFSETGEAVLVNLETLDAKVLRFKVGNLAKEN